MSREASRSSYPPVGIFHESIVSCSLPVGVISSQNSRRDSHASSVTELGLSELFQYLYSCTPSSATKASSSAGVA